MKKMPTRPFIFTVVSMIPPETHTKRQATQQGCLPSLLGDGDKGIEIVYCEEKNILCTGPTRAAKEEQKSLVPAGQAQRTNQKKTPPPFHLYSLSPHNISFTPL
jgi:hypothetical protein